MSAGGGTMTLAFELEAIRRLADPEAVIDDATQWSVNVGIIAEDSTAANRYASEHHLQQDFFIRPFDKRESLVNVKKQFHTDRYVFIGTNQADRELAAETDWEYLPLEDAADKAGWTVERGPGDRVIGWLARLWPF